ncbi:hypothetical protein E4U43_000171 [Claviceps pusilla]|uniref:Succinate dehydrogenase assembly factor 3 n=1 Tax=Claviceps pusilla TaxID=123648 RepID=A0A9P7NCE0_9HYPO|nr:hypothetical protein E4U54_004992 [Claviceps lovelessii]KAG6008332.1 hypothetical protein E4U43_000171 [Claviceps pusilla]
MRCSASMLATAAAATQNSLLRHSSMALLPPLSLYRRLLRAHRKHLPAEMRLLGDEYVKAEFRLHRNVDNPAHLIGFLSEWQLYAQKIEGDAWVGDKVDEAKLQKMSDEQIQQLYDLMQAIKQRHGQGSSDA